MVVFSTKSDYAIIVLRELATSSSYKSLGQLAKQRKLPYRYVSRIAAELKNAGIIESKEGVTGGYRLSKKPEDIKMLDIVQLFENGVGAARCTLHGQTCPRENDCPLKSKWGEIQDEIISVVQKYSLADVI